MVSLKEQVDSLIQDFETGENNEVAFKEAYSKTLTLIQLVYSAESPQCTEMQNAIISYKPGENFAQTRLDLKANCIGVLKNLTVYTPY